MQEQLDILMKAVSKDMLLGILAAIGALAILLVVRKVVRFRASRPEIPVTLPSIDVSSLGEAGPPAGPPTLEYYHLPVRVAAMVVAPGGRGQELPPGNQFPDLLDAAVPGLGQVAVIHRPLVRTWPAQLSPRGFAHAFFGHLRLPGDSGKGTPWCAVAGVCRYNGHPMMVGMVLRTATATNLGQSIIEHETKWLDILRIRRSE